MRVDREYLVGKIRPRHWRGLADRCSLDPDPVMDRIRELVTAIPVAVNHAAAEVREEDLDLGIVDQLEGAIETHVESCLRILDQPSPLNKSKLP